MRYDLNRIACSLFHLGMSITNFGQTLTGGIADISGLSALIGTDQCEKHIGSALEGGFLYAAATPLSLFGALGIVKSGISILVASISIPKLSLSFTPLPKLSFTSSRRLWCGARALRNAGLEPVGSVATLIGMDEERYKAESRLIKTLKDLGIADTPEKLSIKWRSTKWNVNLVISTMAGALISGTPYLYLLLKDPPDSIRSPWVFPFLRAAGSCIATICCQFLIQSRVIALMKSRIIFMTMHPLLVDDLRQNRVEEPELTLKGQKWFQWDESLPAEECLWSLEHYLPSIPDLRSPRSKLQKVRARTRDLEDNSFVDSEQYVNIMKRGYTVWGNKFFYGAKSIPSEPLFFKPDDILRALVKQRAEHFPRLHRTFIVVSWLLLLVSLPAAVVGYIGCFTIVSNSNSPGPLVWLGLEAVLSALRILLWVWNPSWDEKTGVEVGCKLTEEAPPMTTHWDIDALRFFDNYPVPLVPEQVFLAQITPYTGPLTHLKKPEIKNVQLFFVLAVNQEHTQICLLMIVRTNETAITLHYAGDKELSYFNTSITGRMATIKWHSPVKPGNLVYHLTPYYRALLRFLNRAESITWLQWKWSLVLRSEEETQSQGPTPLNLTGNEHVRLQQSREHQLKTRLMKTWGRWIVDGVKKMYCDGRDDCHVLPDLTEDEAFNVLLVRQWTKRELAHLQLSVTLQKILRIHVHQNAEYVVNADQNMPLSLDWSHDLQRQRLEYERAQVKVRREDVLKALGERWSEQNHDVLASIWKDGQTFIDEKWTAAIKHDMFGESSSASPATTVPEWFGGSDRDRASMERLKPRFAHWNDQRKYERREMKATLGRIREADMKQLEQATLIQADMKRLEQAKLEADMKQLEQATLEVDMKQLEQAMLIQIKAAAEKLEQAYRYPESSAGLTDHIYSRFVRLPSEPEESAFVAKVSSATVYDTSVISTIDAITIDAICTVAGKSSCRSLINVRPELSQYIPENGHLLFCSNAGDEVNLPFIQRNRDRWWEQQKTNSWAFYFSPQGIDNGINGSRSAFSSTGIIVHIMIFLQTPTHLRLHLLHSRYGDATLSIQEKGKEIRLIHTGEIPKDELRLQGYDLDRFEPGMHELQLVVSTAVRLFMQPQRYNLRDIALEFIHSPSGSITSHLIIPGYFK